MSSPRALASDAKTAAAKTAVAALSVHGLGKSFGDRAAFADVSFEIGLRNVAEWYAANRSWWEPLKERAPVAETNAWR